MKIRQIEKKAKSIFRLAKDYRVSFSGGLKNRKLFEGIETYCMFVGFPRSGHSLIGALLDAHPSMIIAQELDALRYVRARFSERQIFYLLLEKSRRLARGGQKWGGYVYDIPNQWQGRCKKLQVVGDKHGPYSLLRFHWNPEILKRMYNTINVDIKFINIVRNSYDNIATMSLKRDSARAEELTKRIRTKHQPTINLATKLEGHAVILKKSMGSYFSMCSILEDLKKEIKSTDTFHLKHESFIEDPTTHLKELCHFLGVNAPNDYLNDCANLVYKSPHKSRHDVEWNDELIDFV
ncbi:MAG: sulfotransferase domain-containing protein, partial [Verrucomicrobia bacterium]|nr:sulfotransferase domain-containing protein [Verrucomicrobiota bacterium]